MANKTVVNSLPDIPELGKGTPNFCNFIKDNVVFQKANDPNTAIFSIENTQQPSMVGGAVALFQLGDGIREPHWHPNAWQLTYLLQGKAETSILDPTTNRVVKCMLDKPGMTAFVNMGWLHWTNGLEKDTQLLLFFNNTFQTQNASTLYLNVDASVWNESLDFDPNVYNTLIQPLVNSKQIPVVIGPPVPC
ncbi:cupin domain-containing protein [Longirhabdus pacifica]|uniref:cupin domain-containing protein n=1 Tax=Longirhabdus pacifica TaxID=2305227 RepID=UPI0010086BF9|nr:cupin domain-containing protein [Longirhabdus pacifica]